MKKDFEKTIYTCFTGYIVQAIVNNFIPLLFLTFNSAYGISMSRITFLVTANFVLQLCVDLASVLFVDRIGYRASLILADVFSALGLVSLAFLPDMMPNHYAGIMISVVFYAIGGGLLEVCVSPVVEACPTKNKEAAMSLLHSFYCWGHVGVVLISTGFFFIFGIDNWRILAMLWALVPIANLIAFAKVPINNIIAEGQKQMNLSQLCKSRIFWLFILLMICSGASEQAVSQWASAFAEKSLRVSKTIGDLAGPMFFAITMGTARAIYGKFGDKLSLKKCMIGTGIMCIISYLVISLSNNPVLGLLGCGLCGFSVGIMWPGTFSMASAAIPLGGTSLFAMLALAGDVGCFSGPTYVGLIAGSFGDDLKTGILLAIFFPTLLVAGILLLKKFGKYLKYH